MKDPAELAAAEFDRQDDECQRQQEEAGRLARLEGRISRMSHQVSSIEREAIEQQMRMSWEAYGYLRTCGAL